MIDDLKIKVKIIKYMKKEYERDFKKETDKDIKLFLQGKFYAYREIVKLFEY
jgi:uncharacterized protein YehS (DUF1456 family)